MADWMELLGRAERAGLLPEPGDLELDDGDDEMTVDLAGLCSICGQPVDPDGVCRNGHDDLDRADAAAWLAGLAALIATAEAQVAALIAAAAG